MFSLLNPISLWFGAALAVPLLIHFLGRQRLRRTPFPSLLLVRESFSRSMQRHRLKNLLLLILRTLLILCLLLALSNPAMESRQASVKPDLSLALVHNGIYGRLRLGPAAASAAAIGSLSAGSSRGRNGSDALRTQWRRIRALDSAEGGRTRALPIIADGSGAQDVSERFGDYGEAVGRALAALGSRPGTARLLLPVFDWSDPSGTKATLLRALKENPGLNLVLADYSGMAGRLDAFEGMRATPSSEAPTVNLRIRMSPEPGGGAPDGGAPGEDASGGRARRKIQIWMNGSLFQEAAVEGGLAEVTLPLAMGPRSEGRISEPGASRNGASSSGEAPAGNGFAVTDFYFCFPEAGEWVLAHSGSALASLPSLGRETYYRRILHVASAADIPWDGPRAGDSSGKGGGKDRMAGAGSPRLVYLSAERASRPEVYGRAVEFVKEGGRLIIGVGRESDIPMLNRFLLQPLRLGRMGNLIEGDSATPVSVDRSALARLGRLPADLGSPGDVRKRFAFAPDSGTDILLTQGGPAEAVLAARDFHRGQVLLWTTDIDDLDWSDLGVNPLTPLLHQAFQESGAGERAENLAVASDSAYTVVLPGAVRSGGNGGAAEVRDPEGRPFTKVRADGNRLRIGPFDKLGIYRVLSGGDTLSFAVNLARENRSPAAEDADAGSGSSAEGSSPREARDAFLKDFAAFHGRISVAGLDEALSMRASVRSLWPAFILAAILLLLLEGLISATFSLRRIRR